MIVVYVNNLLVISETKRDEEQALENLCASFPVKGLGEVLYYLRFHIIRDREVKRVTFDQHRWVQTVTE